MGILPQICDAVEGHGQSVEQQVRRAREDYKLRDEVPNRWQTLRSSVPTIITPTGLSLPRLAPPHTDEPGEAARYLYGEGLPGEFPFVNGAYPQMYLDDSGNGAKPAEEPTRLFAGLALAEDTNARFHYLGGHQRTARLSTAFDGPTLYGLDSDADHGVFGKVGEGGVAVDTAEDMLRLYDGFELGADNFSVSMTING